MCLLVTFLLIRSSSDPTFGGIFVCSPLQLISIKNGYPIRVTSIKTWCPFHKPSLERCTTLTTVNAPSLNMLNHKKKRFLDLFTAIRDGPLENLWGGGGRSTKKKFAQGKIT